MKMRLELDMNNAAFDGRGKRCEPGRILLELRHRIMHERLPMGAGDRHSLRDINGNTVGHVTFEEE